LDTTGLPKRTASEPGRQHFVTAAARGLQRNRLAKSTVKVYEHACDAAAIALQTPAGLGEKRSDMTGKKPQDAATHETTVAPPREPLFRGRSRQNPARWLRDTLPGTASGPDTLAVGVSADGAVVLPGDNELDVAEMEVTAVDGFAVPPAKPK
jgi:hypothetical protein